MKLQNGMVTGKTGRRGEGRLESGALACDWATRLSKLVLNVVLARYFNVSSLVLLKRPRSFYIYSPLALTLKRHPADSGSVLTALAAFVPGFVLLMYSTIRT